MKQIIAASKEHEKQFRETWQLKPEYRNNPECEAAFEYAATTKLDTAELNYVGEIIERKSANNRLNLTAKGAAS